MAKENSVEIGFILDKSASMNSLASEAIEGFNVFLKSQQELEGEALLTVVQFDNEYVVTVDGVNVKDVQPLNNVTYVPRGMTALLDAIGVTVNTIGQRLAATKEEDRPSKVIICILTDGEENSSKEFTEVQINEMIKHQTEAYSWEFIFLASTINAIKTAASYGVSGTNALMFSATSDGMSTTYTSMNNAVSSVRSTGTLSANWKDNNGDQDTTTTK